MKLKAKLFIIIGLVFFVFSCCGYAILRLTLYPGYLELERTEAQRDMQRCMRVLENEIDHLANFAGDWARWDDSYQFVLTGNQEFIDSNLIPDTFSQASLNLIYFLDGQGKVLWGQIYDSDFSTVLELPSLIRDRLPRLHPLLQNLEYPKPVRGIHKTSKGPMLISSHPITRSDSANNPTGTLLMGRFLDNGRLESISNQAGVDLSVLSLESPDVPKDVAALFQAKSRPDIYNVFLQHSDTFHSYIPIPDLMGSNPRYILRAEIPRHISIAGGKSLRFALILIFMVGTLILLTLLLGLERIIIIPLQQLTSHTLRVVDEKDLVGVQLPPKPRADEIGILAKEIDKMLQRIQHLYTTQERRVQLRTEDLSQSNKLLQEEVNGHKKTQRQLQHTLDELEIIFQNTQAGILVLKGGRYVARVNQRFCEILGYENPVDVIGLSVRDFHVSDIRYSDFGDKHYKTLAEGAKSQIEYPLKRKDGSVIWCLLAGKAIDSVENSDQDHGTIWIVDDITEKKEAEQRLEDLARLQGVMSTVGAVCHEIAQPIQVIDNQLQMLQTEEDLAAHLPERLEIIKKENARLASTTRKLRKISKYETMDYVSGIKILDIEKSSSTQ